MKKATFIIYSMLVISSCLFAQRNETVTVKAGAKLINYFPPADRYLFQNFTAGKSVYRNGKSIPGSYNYNFLSGEIEFIQSRDTFYITNKKELQYVTIGHDTLQFHDNSFFQVIRSGQIKVYLRQSIKIKEIVKMGAMGTSNRSAAQDTYTYILTGQQAMELIPNDDLILQMTRDFFYSTPEVKFVQFSKKNALRVFPEKEDVIKSYLKSNKINFDSKADILKLADFINSLFVAK